MPKIRWLMIGLCFLANAISYIDRANLAIAAPAIRTELGIDAAAMIPFDQAALDAHMTTPAIKAAGPKLVPILAKPFTQEFLKMVSDG